MGGFRRFGFALFVLAPAVIAGACLAPDQPDPTGTAPIGNLEAVFADGDGIRVQGWAIDPDTTAPVVVSMSSERVRRNFVADRSRPDVAAVHPAYGDRHGFDVRYPGLGPGPRQICVWVDNVGRGSQGRLLGCRTIEVLGNRTAGGIEVIDSTGPERIRVRGWALEDDQPTPAEVALRVDGNFAARVPARTPRPELAGALSGRLETGFAVDVPAPAGRRTLCLTVVGRGPGPSADLGCRVVDVPGRAQDRRATGQVSSLEPGPGSARLRGVVSDPDGPPGQVRVSVDGAAPSTVAVSGGTFDTTLLLAAGTRRVCVTLVDVPSPAGPFLTGDRALPCSTAVIGPLAAGTSGAPVATLPVAPPPGFPLAGVERDAGVSAQLRDGSVVWFFGDSSRVDGNGDLQFFVNNTAAWAAPWAPTVTRDGGANGGPVQFATPTGITCPPDRPSAAMWPMSAVVVPEGSLDRVFVMMANVCLGGPLQIMLRGVSVVDWVYDPARPPVDLPIQATMRNQLLFGPGSLQWGAAAVLGQDGSVYAYGCVSPQEGGFPDAYGPCKVARVTPTSIFERSAWRFWAGGDSWVADEGSAAVITLPDGPDGRSVPIAGFSISRDPVHGVYVMAYNPWPGFTDRVIVRVATSPTGPWTGPLTVTIPGCGEVAGGVEYYCYAGTTQPKLSEPGLLGLGYFDQRVAVGPARGQYYTVKVPFSVVITP